MKRYIRSNRNQHILDNLVDGNKIWDPIDGEFKTLSEEQLAELRDPKPDLLNGLEPSTYYIYKNGKLGNRSVAGEHFDNTKPYRNAGRYKIYLLSFRDAQLPQSKLLIADTETGVIYTRSVIHDMGNFRRDLAELVDWFKAGNTIE